LTTADIPGNSSPSCGVCGRTGDYGGTYAVPGAPVTIEWCNECLQRGCQPMFVVELHSRLHVDSGYMDTAIADHLSTPPDLGESVAAAKQQGIGPDLGLADWFLEEYTWLDGGYVRIRDLLLGFWNEAATPPPPSAA
jgi:hypothetical protein